MKQDQNYFNQFSWVLSFDCFSKLALYSSLMMRLFWRLNCPLYPIIEAVVSPAEEEFLLSRWSGAFPLYALPLFLVHSDDANTLGLWKFQGNQLDLPQCRIFPWCDQTGASDDAAPTKQAFMSSSLCRLFSILSWYMLIAFTILFIVSCLSLITM